MTSELTGDDLDAIQQRTDAFGSRGLYGYVINDIEYQGNWVHDIHRLLQEVDRLRAENTAQAEALAEARGEVAFHHTWDGLMALMEQHYPEEVFPIVAGPDRRDPGPRIVSLVRWVDQVRAELASMTKFAEDLREERDQRLRSEGKRGVERDALAAKIADAAELHLPWFCETCNSPGPCLTRVRLGLVQDREGQADG